MPTEPLTTDQAIEVTFGAGIPSAEGPLPSTTEHTFSMRTYGALRVTGVRCGESPCRPGNPVDLTFNNQLDAATFDPDTVDIEPTVTGRTVRMAGDVITVQAEWQPNTTYTVTVPATVTDVHGQTLGTPDRREVAFGPARPMLRGFDDLVVTADPSAEPAVPVVSVGHEQLHVTVWAADPAQWPSTVATSAA